MGRRGDPAWRDRAAADLLLSVLGDRPPSDPVLVMKDPLPDVADVLEARGHAVSRWHRRAAPRRSASSWPVGDGFATVLLRATKSREELRMDRHAAASVLEAGGSLLVYGAKDEGIRAALGSARDAEEAFFSEPDTLGVGGRCRVLAAGRTEEDDGLRGTLGDWREVVTLDHPRLQGSWVSYPGVFAHPRLDPASRLLLDSLPPLRPGDRVLDYGCGSGVVAAAARNIVPDVEIDALDVDAVALEAVRENVPGARPLLRDGIPPRGASPYDAILSNPPFHRGKAEDTGLLRAMIGRAPGVLGKDGHLVFVTQRRLPVESALESAFRHVSILAENGAFRVWWARSPRLSRGSTS